MCKQELGESIRSYVKRFFDTRATVQSLYRYFGRNRPKTVVDLRDMMQRWADEEEQERSASPAATTTTMGSASTTMEAQATSGILRASASMTI